MAYTSGYSFATSPPVGPPGRQRLGQFDQHAIEERRGGEMKKRRARNVEADRGAAGDSIVLSTLVTQVAKALSAAIIEDRLKPGERLIEYELAERYGVSKSPIREAFRLLEQEGLVTSYPRRGVMVTKINRRDIEELYAIRACLLALQVRLVAEKATDVDLKELDEAFEAMRQAADQPDVKGYFDANIVFHDLLSGIADNRKLAQLLQVSGKQTLRFRFLSLTVPQRIPESLAQHAQVLEALRLRDPAAAERAITELIESTRRAIVDRYLSETRA